MRTGERLAASVRFVLRRTRLARAGQAGLVAATAGLFALCAAVLTGVAASAASSLVAAAVAGVAAGAAYWTERRPTARRVAQRLDRALGLDGALRTAHEHRARVAGASGTSGAVGDLLVTEVERRLDRGALEAVVPATVVWLALPLLAFAAFALVLETSRTGAITIDPAEHWRALAEDLQALATEAALGEGTGSEPSSPADGGAEGTLEALRTKEHAADVERLARRLEREATRLAGAADRADLESSLGALEDEVATLQRELAADPRARAALDRTRARLDALRTGLGLPREPAPNEAASGDREGSSAPGQAVAGSEEVTSAPPAGTMEDRPPGPAAAADVPGDVGVAAGRPWPRRYDAVVEAFVGSAAAERR